tara:strand:+ start:11080 stop:12747 length:1668 start_codon:yes stop_codon:yes gene_type:complete
MKADVSAGRPYETVRAERAAQALSATMMNIPLSVMDFIGRAETYFADHEIVVRQGRGAVRRLNWGKLAQDVRALATALTSLGVKHGDRVASLMWNNEQHLALFYAVPAIGAVLHTLNPRLSADELAYIMSDAGDNALFVDEDLLPLWNDVAERLTLPLVIVNGAAKAGEGRHAFADLLLHAPLTNVFRNTDENAPLSICYTSGTTGRPKGVVYSHRSTVLHTLAVNQPDALALSCRDCILPLAPMFHVNAWGTPYIAAMVGAKMVLAGAHITPEEILDLMEREGVTHALGVPTIWAGVLDMLERFPGRWTLRAGIRFEVGGSAAPADMFRRCDRLGIALKHGWGMTECSPIGAQVPLSPRYDKASDDERLTLRASNGIAQPLVGARIVDDAGQALEHDGMARGELQVRGPFITDHYIGVPAPIPACTSDGWLKTGDVATINAEGYIKIVDRLKDLIKSGGEWISSIDMEGALMSHPDIAEAAVIGVPDPKWAERPLAIIVFKSARRCEIEDIKSFLTSRYPRWMVPEHYVVIDEIPKTATGKFNKRLLRETYGGA